MLKILEIMAIAVWRLAQALRKHRFNYPYPMNKHLKDAINKYK